MHGLSRPAQPGDMFVLLVPSEDELPGLLQRQSVLQARFGGRPQKELHLTCQRFSLPGDRPTEDVVRQLETRLSVPDPFPIVALDVMQYPSSFWCTSVLLWRVPFAGALYRLCVLVDGVLADYGAELHYPFSASSEPKHVTVLRGVPQADLDGYQPDAPYPHHLFFARIAVCSRLKEQSAFEILARWPLGTPD
jgi:hypothetical protein